MKLAVIYIALFIALYPDASAQGTRVKFWVQFADKWYNDFSLQRPGEFLSRRALDRRARQGIPIYDQDLPVSPPYLDSLRRYPLKVLYTSKWMNAAVVETADSTLAQTLPLNSWVTEVRYLYDSDLNRKSGDRKLEDPEGFGSLSPDEQLNILQIIHTARPYTSWPLAE